MEYIAHIKDDDASDGVNRIEETVTEHSEKVAKLAEKYGQPLRIPHIVCIGAMLHDVGKLNKDFSEYIRGSSRYERGDIDHSYAGARYLEEYTAGTNGYVRYTAQLIARIIISHHGLHDWWTDKCKNYYKNRCSKQERYKEINDNIKQFISDNELNKILIEATNEYSKIDEKIQQICNSGTNTISLVTKAFYFGMLERLAESCLIDADRTATAEFMEGIEITEPSEDEIQRNWLDMKQHLDNKLSKFSGSDSLISKLRMNISDRCCAFAKNDVGISQLIVPTGGGKTLSALRFAIEYAVEHKKERIFYISPFMSILEQNGDVIREIAGDDNYLEHHSDMYCKIVGDKSKSKAKVAEELEDYELRCQHWDKPLIATTMLQFVDTLFSSRTEAIRRMHRFTNSVIIIDEVQSIPVKCVYIFNLAMNFLANFMGCTIVLCTATQPTLEQCKYPIMLDKESSMTGDYKQDFVDFARTKITPLLDNKGGYSYGEAAAVCMDKYRENGNILFVVNTKDAAAKVYSEVSNLNKEESFQAKLIHLSTNMCPAHRRNAIEDIRDMLNKDQPVICITTQLIEAGVDISFKCVIRSHAGMENVAQAAGRCNRNGEKVCGDVYIIELKEENVSSLGELTEARQQSINTIIDVMSKKSDDYLSVDAIEYDDLYDALGVNGLRNNSAINVIKLSKQYCSDYSLLRQKLSDDYKNKVSYQTDNVGSLACHELGHAIHKILAFKRAGLEYGKPISAEQNILLNKKLNEICIEIYEAAFDDSFETPEAIFDECAKQLGSMAVMPNELIAQSFGNYYYGSDKMPIAKSIIEYFIKELS